ncbi:MAG: hypothetical protein GY903_07535 [Fuerstiella sp.]|nr:hypothetical protein [Fuerstiella sp.]
MHSIAAAVARGDRGIYQEVIRDVRSRLDEQMAPETQLTRAMGGSDRDESGRAASGDVATESGGGEPSGEAEALEK